MVLRVDITGLVQVQLFTRVTGVTPGETGGERGKGKDELFGAKRKSGTSSLTVLYLAACMIFCDGPT